MLLIVSGQTKVDATKADVEYALDEMAKSHIVFLTNHAIVRQHGENWGLYVFVNDKKVFAFGSNLDVLKEAVQAEVENSVWQEELVHASLF